MSPTYLLKIVTVGSASVGKTSMIIRYSTGSFREHYSPTLGTGFSYKKIKLDENFVTLQIWDMGSQDFLERVRANYYIGTHGIFFIYDITSLESFTDIYDWIDEVNRNLDDYEALLIGNKSDLAMERVVSIEEGKKLAEQCSMDYVETSVRLNTNVNETFGMMTKSIIDHFF